MRADNYSYYIGLLRSVQSPEVIVADAGPIGSRGFEQLRRALHRLAWTLTLPFVLLLSTDSHPDKVASVTQGLRVSSVATVPPVSVQHATVVQSNPIAHKLPMIEQISEVIDSPDELADVIIPMSIGIEPLTLTEVKADVSIREDYSTMSDIDNDDNTWRITSFGELPFSATLEFGLDVLYAVSDHLHVGVGIRYAGREVVSSVHRSKYIYTVVVMEDRLVASKVGVFEREVQRSRDAVPGILARYSTYWLPLQPYVQSFVGMQHYDVVVEQSLGCAVRWNRVELELSAVLHGQLTRKRSLRLAPRVGLSMGF